MVNFQQGDTYSKNSHIHYLHLSSFILKALAVFLLIYTLAEVTPISLPAFAQTPNAPFEITISPAAEQAVAGEVFTYTVVITNVSPNSIDKVVVTIDIPDGATLIESRSTSLNWYGGNPFPGETITEVNWLTVEPVLSGEVVTFDLIVKVLPQTANQELLMSNYYIAVGNRTPLVFGLPLRTRVLAVTPTPTSIPSPTPTSLPTIIPTSTVVPTPQATATEIKISLAVSPIVSQSNLPLQNSSFSITWGNVFIIGILSLILLTIVAVWFVKR